jgi:alpha-L-fucosidase 2
MAHVYSRLGKPGRALQSLQLMCRSIVGVNLFTAHNDMRDMGITMDYRKGPRPLVQTEANNGVTSAVYEMLALSTPDTLRLLPALPFSWKSGNLTGLRLRGGGQLDIYWDRTGNWWRSRFSGPSRRVTVGKMTQATTAPELANQAADGLFTIDGCFCESGEAILQQTPILGPKS